MAVTALEVALAAPDHHLPDYHHKHLDNNHHEHHVAPHHEVEDSYDGASDHGYSHDVYHHDYDYSEQSVSYDAAPSVYTDPTPDIIESNWDISPKVRVKLLSILIVLVLLLGAVALEVAIDFYMNIGFMNKAREFQGLGRANHAMPLTMEPEVVMSIISSIR